VTNLHELRSGERTCTGVELRESAMRAAAAMASLGIGCGDRVAVLLRNDVPFLEATLAAQHLGAYAVPINWHSTAEEIHSLLQDCMPSLLIAHTDLLAGVPRPSTPVRIVDTPEDIALAYRVPPSARLTPGWATSWVDWISQHAPHRAPAMSAPESLIYTSGTSGRPRGVRRTAPTPEQARLTERMRGTLYGLSREARVLIPAPLYHTAPNMFALRAVNSAEFILLPTRFDARALLADIERERITHLYAVATMFQRLLQLPAAERQRYDLSTLRFVLHSGGPCAPDTKRAMLDWWGPIVHEYYGSTEAGPVTLCAAQDWLLHPGTVGRAVDGARIAVLDENGQTVPPRTVGEVCAANSAYPDFTYLHQPEARAELQRGDLVATGDLGWLDEEGFLYLSDRKKDLVISGGVNLYPAEIEAVLLTLDGVADCAVFGIPDAEFGEALAAVVEPQRDARLTADSLRAALSNRLPRFKQPRLIEVRDTLPRQESGKILKRLLRDPYWVAMNRLI
jgi:long-chain acyl-CoA synthetase